MSIDSIEVPYDENGDPVRVSEHEIYQCHHDGEVYVEVDEYRRTRSVVCSECDTTVGTTSL